MKINVIEGTIEFSSRKSVYWKESHGNKQCTVRILKGDEKFDVLNSIRSLEKIVIKCTEEPEWGLEFEITDISVLADDIFIFSWKK